MSGLHRIVANLCVETGDETGDEIGALAHCFNRFIASLNRIIGDVRVSTATISSASREIAAGTIWTFPHAPKRRLPASRKRRPRWKN